MSAVVQRELVTVADYLAAETASPIKHEYLGGYVYAMSGGTFAHNLIASNTLGELHAQLRNHHCNAFNPDMKIRTEQHHQTRFYYPDVSVVCSSTGQDELFLDRPVVLVEVLSDSTRRIDEGEKKDAYLGIDSLLAYVLLEQAAVAATCFRRTAEGFSRELYTGREAVIALPEIDCELKLADAYANVALPDQPS